MPNYEISNPLVGASGIAANIHNHSECTFQIRTCANCAGQHDVFHHGYPIYRFEAEIVALRFKQGLTLKEARIETRRLGFSPQPATQFFNKTPSTTTSHVACSTSIPASLFFSSIPSCSTSTSLPFSSISVTPSTSAPISTSNPFLMLNPESSSSLSSSSYLPLPQRSCTRQTKRCLSSGTSTPNIRPPHFHTLSNISLTAIIIPLPLHLRQKNTLRQSFIPLKIFL
ncbi:hypothetical protein E2C01_012341 [Portunus trituberculatus]|uniref:Uncharacterized protein n=1 Tax=Portunus trituberculatus TaxID=210409 RepID=A0A5B7DDY0_PORTR|nr:hypothetical protein [Portunus trituberculatus]